MNIRRIGAVVRATLVCPETPSAVRFSVLGPVRGAPLRTTIYTLGLDAEVTSPSSNTYTLTITIPELAIEKRDWTIAAIGVGGEVDGDAEPRAVRFRVERSAFGA